MITDSDLAFALNRIKGKQKSCRLYNDYYHGHQNLAFASDAFQTAFGHLFKSFSYNRCGAVVDAVADRLTVKAWETDGKQDGSEDPIEQAAGDIWRRNKMQKRQGEVHTEALRSGMSYVVVWPDEETGEARITPNCGHVMTAVYEKDYGERIAFAVKVWPEYRGENAGKWRLTIYEPDVITRMITPNKRDDFPEKLAHFQPYEDDNQPEAGNPYGRVPVFHFANNARTGDEGYSELAAVIPLQDALNKSVMDGLVAAEFLGFPQRVVTGIDVTLDPHTGQPEKPFDVAMDRLVVLSDAAAKFGSFDAADMGQFTNLQNEFDVKIARVSRVPVHWLNQTGNNFSSGEALKTAEAPLTSKIRDRMVSFGDVWADAMQFALEIDGVAGDTKGIQPIWEPAETRSELDMLNSAALRSSLGIPPEQIWRELGYSTDEIAEFSQLKDEAAAKSVEAFSASFDKGNVPIGGS